MKFAAVTAISAFAFFQMSLAQTTCTAQNIFDNCLSMEDTYLKTCVDQDYSCLCRWHRAKLSCYDNCPNDPGKASQQGMKDTYCSIADTFKKNVTASSVAPPVAAATVLPSPSAAVATSPSTNSTSSCTLNHYYNQDVLMFVAGVTTYFLI